MKKVIEAQTVPKAGNKDPEWLRILARMCYYYPQYTLAQARRLPARRVRLLLETALQIEAERMYQLTQIAAAPHTKKFQGVKKLTKHFKNLMGA